MSLPRNARTTARLPLNTLALGLYLEELSGPYYTAEAELLESHDSTIIHSDATTTPATWGRFRVWLSARHCDYTTCYHYVTVGAKGRLSGALRKPE